MPVQKKKVISFKATDYSIYCLQELKYLDGRKKAMKKNLSEFLNHLIVDFYKECAKDGSALKKKQIAHELHEATKKRNKYDIVVTALSEELRAMKGGSD